MPSMTMSYDADANRWRGHSIDASTHDPQRHADPKPKGRHTMVLSKLQHAVISLAAIVGIAIAGPAGAEEFPAGVRDTLGPGFGARPHAQPEQAKTAVNV